MKNSARIQIKVPLTIFDEPTLKEKLNNLLEGSKEEIKVRVEEILDFLDLDFDTELSYDNIARLFKGYFCEFIINKAIEIALTEQGKYNILNNILSLLSKEKLENAIMGKPMVDAFSHAIRSLPTTTALQSCLHGSKIILLEKRFV